MTMPDPTPHDVAQVARRLTATMREAVLYLPRGYFDPNTIKALRRRGLLNGGVLNEFGLAVREYLKEQNDG